MHLTSLLLIFEVCAAILPFSEITADSLTSGKFNVALYDSDKYMRLDGAAQKVLNVMNQRTDANDNFSPFDLMSRGRTAMARHLLEVLLNLIESLKLIVISISLVYWPI